MKFVGKGELEIGVTAPVELSTLNAATPLALDRAVYKYFPVLLSAIPQGSLFA